MKQIFDVKRVPAGAHIGVLLTVTESKREWVEDYSPPPRGHSGYETVERTVVEYWVAESEKDLCDWLKGVKLEGLQRRSYVILRVSGQLTPEFSLSLKEVPGDAHR